MSSTRESVVFTLWPPGPDDREKRQFNSAPGIVRRWRLSCAVIRRGYGYTGWARPSTRTRRVSPAEGILLLPCVRTVIGAPSGKAAVMIASWPK